MSNSIMSIVLVTFLSLFQTVNAENALKEKVRVGTFDSRAIAMAYYRSDAFKRQMKDIHAELEKAKADGNEKRVRELEEEGPALQTLVHKQGFGTWPVDNLLEKIKEEIPKIAKTANVDVIVSKWDIVFQKPGVELVDVTDELVKPFVPNEETLKIIRDICACAR